MKGPERANKRIRNREQCNKSRLIVTLKGFRPPNMNRERRRGAGNIHLLKVMEGIERRSRRRSLVGNT
jgi:hypothetical protein